MATASRSLKQLFLDALAVPPAERAAWLSRECADDAALRQQLELMLAAHDAPQSLLDRVVPPTTPGPVTEDYAAETIPAGTQIGPYKLLQQIGEGGFGIVFMAEQTEPVRRRVALKLIKPGMDTRQVIARFEAERQALAVMDHPNIAKVLDAGTIGEPGASAPGGPPPAYAGGSPGRPYFVMELVRGVPITQYCDENSLSIRERLELFASVCQAIQHAHTKGIIHRDIKPTNVLVTRQDGQPVVKVIDFGIAKALGQQLTDKTLFTDFAQMIGTPLYMSPEQAELSSNDIDTRSDIYSLGVLLYELLTGSTPVSKEQLKAAAFDEIRRIIREDEAQRPSNRISTAEAAPSIAAQRHTEPAKLARLVRGELDWIVLKALEKDRSRRYETASGFAADVQRYLADEAVQACPPSAGYRLRKFARRNKRTLATVVALALALVAGTMVSTWQAIRATRAEGLAATRLGDERKARKEADDARQQSENARSREQTAHRKATRLADENWQQVYAARINLVQQYFEQGDVANAIQLLESLRPVGDRQELRSFEWYYLWRLCHGERLTFRADDGPVLSVAYSPDGRFLATGSQKGSVKLWDAKNAEVLADLASAGDEIRSIAFSPDGTLLAAACGSPGKAGSVHLWDTAAHTKLRKLDAFTKPVLSLAFSPDGATLATGTAQYVLPLYSYNPLARLFWIEPGAQTAEVQLWDVSTGHQRTILPGETSGILCLAFSSDGKALAAAGWDATIRLWDLADPQKQTTLTGHTSYVWSVAFSPDGRTLASASGKWDGQPEVRLWDLPAGRERALLRGHAAGVTALAFSPNGQSLATSSWDRTVRLWDVTTAEVSRVLRGHTNYVAALAFSPDGEFLATGSWDGTARLWETRRSRDHTSLGSDDLLHCYSLSFSPDGRQLAAAGSASVAVFDLATGERSVVIPGQPNQALVAFAPDGKTLAVAGIAHPEGNVRIFDTKNWQLRFALDAGASTVWTLAFSPDSRLLATGQKQDLTIRLWDVETGKHRVLYRGEPAPGQLPNIRTLVFSPDGQTLAACRPRGSPAGLNGYDVSAWNVETGQVLFRLDTGYCECIAFSPDGKILAAALGIGPDQHLRGVQLWDLETRQLRATLSGHAEVVYHAAFSPDSRTLATGSWDSTVRLWHVATAQPLVTLKGHRGAIYCVAFSPDGQTLASSSQYRQAPRDALAADRLLWHAAIEEGALGQSLPQKPEVRQNGKPTTSK